MRVVLSIVLIATFFSVTVEVEAVPHCSQITYEDFCAACGPGYIEWQGSCTAGDRQWRCIWTDCNGERVESDWVDCACPGEPGGCDCLLAGTPVTLADGSTKAVESIRVGDQVLSLDERTGAMASAEVTAVHAPFPANHYYIVNGTIGLTETHPVRSHGRWLNASELQVGDIVEGADGAPIPILSIERVDERVMVHNFQVSTKTYLAGGILVHNKEICENFVLYPY